MDRDVFVEAIPFSETRRYVKKVLRNYDEYRRIYAKTVPAAWPVQADGIPAVKPVMGER
jgi:hypothetical protein